MHRNTIDFSISIIYSTNLPNSSINVLIVVVLWFSIYKIMLSASRCSFTSCFIILDAFYFFSCLIALVSTFSIMLDRGD